MTNRLHVAVNETFSLNKFLLVQQVNKKYSDTEKLTSWSSLAFCSASSKFGIVTDEATGQHARLETLHSCFTPLTDPTLDAFSENSKSVLYAETIRLILAPLADHSSH